MTALSGVRVLDLTHAHAGPICTMYMAAMGAEMFVRVSHPVLGEMVEPGFPIKFSETCGDATRPAPPLDEHTAQVLGEALGMTADEVEALRRGGVV